MNDTDKLPWYSFVPNLLTLLNLSLGCIAVWYALNMQLQIAALLMIAAALFDFMDGFVARLLKVTGELGKQLDSLADMVSFGVLPGAIAFSISNSLIVALSGALSNFVIVLLHLLPLMIPVFSALRLAKFNIDTRQKTGFIGLPTPANALLWASAGWSFNAHTVFYNNPSVSLSIVAIALVVFSLLLVSNLPMFALKFSSYKWSQNSIRYIFLIISFLLVLVFRIEGIGICVIAYIAISLFSGIKHAK